MHACSNSEVLVHNQHLKLFFNLYYLYGKEWRMLCHKTIHPGRNVTGWWSW